MSKDKQSKASYGRHLRYGLYGLYMGFILTRIGFADYNEVHKMFTFTELNLFLTFCGGVGISSLGYWSLRRLRNIPVKALHPGSIVGGIIFGLGWAITGACPSVALIMIGGGQIAAVATLVGVLIGTWLYPRIHRRFFGWDNGACGI